jgi:mycofactocin precursor
MNDQDVIETKAEPGQAGASAPLEAGDGGAVVLGELLIEEVSIDGMCGVY